MQIVFHHINYYSLPLIFFLKLLKFKIFYIYIASNTVSKKKKVFKFLKRINIHPLPIEFVKKIENKNWAESDQDTDCVVDRYSKTLFDDNYLKKITHFFDTGKNFSKLRVMFNNYLSIKNVDAAKVKIWAENNLDKKIFFLSYDLSAIFVNLEKKNIYKIVIPLNFNFIKILINILCLPFKNIFLKKKKIIKNYQKEISTDYSDKICIVSNQGRNYGDMFKKDIFYSKKVNSLLNEKKILHLSYDHAPIYDVKFFSLMCTKFETLKLIFNNLPSIFKILGSSIYSNNFLSFIIVLQCFIHYTKFKYKLRRFKNLKVALIDFDFVCPKELILALQSNKIKTIAVQERPLLSFNKAEGIILDEYFVFSEFFKKQIESNKTLVIDKIVVMGPYRAEWINYFKKDKTKLENKIQNNIKNYKKLVIVLGYTTDYESYDSNIEIVINWSSHQQFLNDIIKLATNFENNLFVFRFKNLEWTKNKFFKNEIAKIKKNKNVILSSEYSKNRYVYNLISKADLIIAKYCSAADEALSVGIPVIFHDYTINLNTTMHSYTDYFKNYLFCHSYEELLKNTRYFFSNSLYIKTKIKKINIKIHKHNNISSLFKIKNYLIRNIEEKLNK